jgi:hypothetical protein
MGDVRVADDEKQVYINKIGVMGGGTTVGNPGDKLTGNKVGIMGGDEPPKETAPRLRTSLTASHMPRNKIYKGMHSAYHDMLPFLFVSALL